MYGFGNGRKWNAERHLVLYYSRVLLGAFHEICPLSQEAL